MDNSGNASAAVTAADLNKLLDEALEAEASVLVIAPTGGGTGVRYLCGIAPMHPGQRP